MSKLKAANAGIQISQVGMITQYQTTVSTSIFLYPLELQKNIIRDSYQREDFMQ